MENLQAVAAFLRKQLAEIDAKIAELAPKPKPEPVFDLHQEVLNLRSDKEWKKFIGEPYNVVLNITYILDECYDPYVDFIKEHTPETDPTSLIGEFGSVTWRKFQLKIIEKLLVESDLDNDFSDTAGGCDEVAWDAGLDVIRELA
jgi:hypothetical protein